MLPSHLTCGLAISLWEYLPTFRRCVLAPAVSSDTVLELFKLDFPCNRSYLPRLAGSRYRCDDIVRPHHICRLLVLTL